MGSSRYLVESCLCYSVSGGLWSPWSCAEVLQGDGSTKGARLSTKRKLSAGYAEDIACMLQHSVQF